MGKGSQQRPTDLSRFRTNYDAVEWAACAGVQPDGPDHYCSCDWCQDEYAYCTDCGIDMEDCDCDPEEE